MEDLRIGSGPLGSILLGVAAVPLHHLRMVEDAPGTHVRTGPLECGSKILILHDLLVDFQGGWPEDGLNDELHYLLGRQVHLAGFSGQPFSHVLGKRDLHDVISIIA